MIKKGKATELSQGIADVLSGLRDKIGFTQRQMAEKIGVTVQQYQKYEKGKDRLPLERALVLCDDLNVPLGTFMRAISGVPGFAEEKQAEFGKPERKSDEEEVLAVFRSVPKKSRKEFLEAMRKMAKMAETN